MLRLTLSSLLLASLTACATAGADNDNPRQAQSSEGEGEGTEGEGEEGEGEEGEGEGEEGEGEGEGVVGEGEGEGDPPPPPASLSVLLIGNSQLGLNPPDVAAALESLSRVANDGGSVLVVDRKQNFGESCRNFILRADVTAAAASGDYDVVVLMPSIGESAGDAGCWQDFRELAEGAGSQFAVMATAHVLAAYPSGFNSLHNAVKNYADSQGVLYIPAGQVWREVIGDSPSTATLSEFYSSDSQHPGAEGNLLYVYTLYAALTGRSAVGLPTDILELRCDMDQACLSYQALDDCVSPCAVNCSPTPGEYNCSPQNGALFGPNGAGVAFVTDDEAARYQAAVDAVLAE